MSPMPIEPPATQWLLPTPAPDDPDDLVGLGADLAPGTLLAAYRQGLFPMPMGRSRDPMCWWSPAWRGVLPVAGLRVSRSLRRSCRDFEIRIDTTFDEVVLGCSESGRDGDWITPAFRTAYGELHRLGWAHSVEAWRDGILAGGLYGVGIGGLFAGESMFHRVTDASKAALVGLVDVVRRAGGDRLIDVQWRTDHLATLGVVEIPRAAYLARLERALTLPDLFEPE